MGQGAVQSFAAGETVADVLHARLLSKSAGSEHRWHGGPVGDALGEAGGASRLRTRRRSASSMWSGAKLIRPDGADEFREGTHDSCAEWLNSLLRAPTVREGSSTFSLSHFKSLPRALTVREGSSTRQHTLRRGGDPPCRAATRCTDGGEIQERERPSLTVGALSGSPDAAAPASPPILLSTAGFFARPIGADEFREGEVPYSARATTREGDSSVKW